METNNRQEKKENLKKQLKLITEGTVGVAFSGGVDSSLLLKMACECAKENKTQVKAFMMQTELLPINDVEIAKQVAEEIGAEFYLLSAQVLKEAEIEDNPVERCYLCKKIIFSKIREEAQKMGASVLIEGTNADDLLVYRPGIRAIKELEIVSPLADAQLTKKEVRNLAEEYGIMVADRPSTPCMATRFPYGTRLTIEKLEQVKKGEEYLQGLGLYSVRLRVHGDIARIEVDASSMDDLLKKKTEVVTYLKALGYPYITLDLEGFRSGSMDILL